MVVIILWGTIYQELWEREEKLIVVKWGTAGFEEAEKDRYNRPHDKGIYFTENTARSCGHSLEDNSFRTLVPPCIIAHNRVFQ